MLNPKTAADNLRALPTATDRAPAPNYQTSVAERVISLQPRYQYDMQLFLVPPRIPDSGLQHAITRDPSDAT
jgi:hypothetical protein